MEAIQYYHWCIIPVCRVRWAIHKYRALVLVCKSTMCNIWIYHRPDNYHSPWATQTGIWPFGNWWERETTDRRNRWTIPAALWPFRFNINRKNDREKRERKMWAKTMAERQRRRTKGVVLKYFTGYFLDFYNSVQQRHLPNFAQNNFLSRKL